MYRFSGIVLNQASPQISRYADVTLTDNNIAFQQIDVPHETALLRQGFGGHPASREGTYQSCEARSAKQDGGAGGIRTLDRALQPYNGLANRRLQPLGHSSIEADMPDAGASRKRQIPGYLIRSHLATCGLLIEALRCILKPAPRICYTRVANA